MKIVDVKTHVMGTAWRNLTFVRVLEKGYRALKFDPCGSGFYELDKAEKHRVIELVEAVYDAVGPDVEILIEMLFSQSVRRKLASSSNHPTAPS